MSGDLKPMVKAVWGLWLCLDIDWHEQKVKNLIYVARMLACLLACLVCWTLGVQIQADTWVSPGWWNVWACMEWLIGQTFPPVGSCLLPTLLLEVWTMTCTSSCSTIIGACTSFPHFSAPIFGFIPQPGLASLPESTDFVMFFFLLFFAIFYYWC